MGLIWSFLLRESGRTTDFSFLGVMMWVDYFHYSFCIAEDTLFIKGVLEDDRTIPAFSLPIGSMAPERWLSTIRAYCRRHNLPLEFSAIPDYALPVFERLQPVVSTELPDWGDYLYDAQELATLRGKKMAKKRNHVNSFNSEYAGRWTFEPLSPLNCGEALAFMDVADLEGDENRSAIDERRLTRRVIEAYPLFAEHIKGGLLRIDGKVAAFTIGDVKGDTLYVHIEKADRNVRGCYEKINNEFAAYMLSCEPSIKYINREDDAGDEGLRKAKLSYHPIEFLKKHNIIFLR